jgi:hypothetical protein
METRRRSARGMPLLTPRKPALDNGEMKARTDEEDRFERACGRPLKTSCGTMGIQISDRLLASIIHEASAASADTRL